eukprot:4711810-Pleurochrysis_carterae.AAC.1
MQEVGVHPTRCVSLARDSDSVNGAACRTLTTNPFDSSLGILCISHTLNNAGLRLQMDILGDWMT